MSKKTEVATQLMLRSKGATMDEITQATGKARYGVIARLEARGYRIEKVLDGEVTRYFATAPDSTTHDATITSQGQVTIPKIVRQLLKLRTGDEVRFTIKSGTVNVTFIKQRSEQ